MHYIGIDPGITGATVILDSFGCYVTGWNHRVENNMIKFDLLYLPPTRKTVIEKPFTPGNQKGTETTWRNYQTLYLLYNPDIEIRPLKWKKALGIPTKLTKKESIQFQMTKFCPVVDVNNKKIDWYAKTPKGNKSSRLNDGLIDAYCIAYYLYKNPGN